VTPLPWIVRFAPLIPPGGEVLDLACGSGRHSRLMLERGHPVCAVDRDVSRLSDIAETPGLNVLEADLETATDPFGPGGILQERQFAGIIVTNYLYRPLIPGLFAALSENGILIYQTFALGNEAYGRPRNPDFLLHQGELLEMAEAAGLEIVAYKQGLIDDPAPAIVGQLCARRSPNPVGKS
jgi:SAM-dependent methyltransferase